MGRPVLGVVMKVSAVITNFKYDKWLPQAVKSCEGADKIFVIHDGPCIAAGVAIESKGFQLHVADNHGVSYCRNIGIKHCTTDIVLILDADDYLTENSISKRLKIFEENPDVDIVHGPVLRFDEESGPDKAKLHPSLLTFQGAMIRKRVFEKFGLYYEKLRSSEDKEMLYRWGLHRHSPFKKRIKDVKVDFPVAYYRRHGDSKRKRRKTDRHFDIETMMNFDARVKDLELNGINKNNTEFLEIQNGTQDN